MTYEDGTGRVFRNVGTENSDARKSSKRKNTTFTTRRNCEIILCFFFSPFFLIDFLISFSLTDFTSPYSRVYLFILLLPILSVYLPSFLNILLNLFVRV